MTVVPQFAPPGPGFWERDPVHFPRPLTRYWTETHPEPFTRRRRIRALLRDADRRPRDDLRQRLRLQADRAGGRTRRSRSASSARRRPSPRSSGASSCATGTRRSSRRRSRRTARSSRSIPTLSDDADLAAYLVRCRDHHAEMIYQHMRFTAAAIVPTGDFLAHVGDWTGLGLAELLGLMRGSAPVSAGASDQLNALIAAVGRIPARRSSSSRTTTRRQCSTSCARSTADRRRRRPPTSTSSGTGCSTASTSRTRTRSSCRTRCCARSGGRRRGDRRGRLGRRGADRRRARQGARTSTAPSSTSSSKKRGLTYRVRDERGVFSDIWASGLMRRAALAAGRRLAEAGTAPRAGAPDRCRRRRDAGARAGAGGPSADELAGRAA